MKGLAIFLHSVRLVFSNLEAALRISLVLFLVSAVLQFWLSTIWAPMSQEIMSVDPGRVPDMPPAGFVMTAFFSAVVTLAISLWIAVAWHRFVLLGEMPAGWVPRMNGGLMLGYLGRSILLGLVCMIAALIAGAIVGSVLAIFSTSAAATGGTVAVAAAGFYMFYRLCAILPAGAVGKQVTFFEAWTATRGTGTTILVLVVLSVLTLAVLQIPTMLSGNPNSTISVIYGLVIGWPVTMVGASLLTTFYGHYIEGRPID